MIGEILELHQHAGKNFLRGHHEFFDEIVVFGAGDAALTQADVVEIVAQRIVVGAHIQRDRQAQLRVDAGARRV